MGAVGGGAFHFPKGAYHSPRGERLLGGLQTTRVGGSFAVWGGLFSAFDCSIVFLRQKENPWNSILSGAATGGLLSVRRGALAASRSALVGDVLLAFIEGTGITLNRLQAAHQENNMPVSLEEGQNPEPATSSSWLGRWFGGGDKKEEETASGLKVEVFESFDSPMPPTFEFN